MYITGKPLCASKADESDSPVFTRVATSSICAAKCAFFWFLASICSEPRIGNPALISVRNCWLKIRNGSSLTLRLAKPANPVRAFTEKTW